LRAGAPGAGAMGWIHLPQVGEIQLCVPSFGKTLAASSLGAVGWLGGWGWCFLSKFPAREMISNFGGAYFFKGVVVVFFWLDHSGC